VRQRAVEFLKIVPSADKTAQHISLGYRMAALPHTSRNSLKRKPRRRYAEENNFNVVARIPKSLQASLVGLTAEGAFKCKIQAFRR